MSSRHGHKDSWGEYHPQVKEHRPSFWVCAQRNDRCYGGPEEGGWWFDYRENLAEPYRFPRLTRKVHRYLAKLRRKLGDVRLHQHGCKDWPDLSSVNADCDDWAGIMGWKPNERLCSGGYC